MDFTQVLINALSSDQAAREGATKQLHALMHENLGLLLQYLGNHLARDDLVADIRTVAGLTAKNALKSTDPAEQEIKSRHWLTLDETTKASVRALALQGLAAADSKVGTTAAQLVAAIAAIDLPASKWPDVIRQLLHNIQASGVPKLIRSSLEALGFICEEVGESAPDVLVAASGDILQAVVLGADDNQPDDVKLAAITALHNSLGFVRRNFEREADRNYIMQVVCSATQKPIKAVKVVAFQCLVRIIMLYYDFMHPYMETALYALTVYAMQTEEQPVVLQAIEFWSTVCDTESEIDFLNIEAEDSGLSPPRINQHFSKTALRHIIPPLLTLLTKQDEDADDEWNISRSAATCIYLLAKCVTDDIVGLILPFVEQNIRHQDWRQREAALMAFGSILEGPDPQILTPLAGQALPLLIQSMGDPKPAVQDTAAWAVGCICDLLYNAIDPALFPSLMEALGRGLKQDPRVAASCAWAINNLAENMSIDEPQKTYRLSVYFPILVTALLDTIARPDGGEANLRISAFAALTALVESAAEDTYPVLMQLTQVMLDRLDKGIANENQFVSADDRREHVEEQASICAILTAVVRKLETQIIPLADHIMNVCLKIFASPTSSRNADILEDAILTVGALASALGRQFARYIEAFNPFLVQCLGNIADHTVCLHSVGLVGDICRALGDGVAPYTDMYMTLLLANAQNNEVHRDVKPHILSCFGDIAMAINEQFLSYLPNAMMVLRGASEVQLNQGDFGEVDYMNTLRGSIVEGYVGIIQVFTGPDLSRALLPYCEAIVQFAKRVFQDPTKSEDLQRATIGMLGDLAESCGRQLSPLFTANFAWINSFCTQCANSKNQQTQETATWASQRIHATL